MFGIKTKLSLLKTKWLWRRMNEDNSTYPVSPIADLSNIQVGRFSYGPIDLHSSSKAPHLKIGSCCSIASNVAFVIHDDHPTDSFSSFPFRVMALGDVDPEAIDKGGIVLEDDVWIGYRATILDGVTIHRGGSLPPVPSFAKTFRLIPSLAVFLRNQSRRGSTTRRFRDSWLSIIPKSPKLGFKNIYGISTRQLMSAF